MHAILHNSALIQLFNIDSGSSGVEFEFFNEYLKRYFAFVLKNIFYHFFSLIKVMELKALENLYNIFHSQIAYSLAGKEVNYLVQILTCQQQSSKV
jgi:hypothetical protein